MRHHTERGTGVNSPPALDSPEDSDIGDILSPLPDTHSPDAILTRKQACLFLLKAKELYKVSENNLDSLTGDISGIVESTVNYLEHKLKLELEERGIGMDSELQRVFNSPQVFQGLQTQYLRKKYIKESLALVVSTVFA